MLLIHDSIEWLRFGVACLELGAGLISAVAQARACPPNVAYAGQPFIAYLAGRAMPDNQPDQFIVMSPALRSVAAKIGAVHPLCM